MSQDDSEIEENYLIFAPFPSSCTESDEWWRVFEIYLEIMSHVLKLINNTGVQMVYLYII